MPAASAAEALRLATSCHAARALRVATSSASRIRWPSAPVLRRPVEPGRYVSIRYTERLADAGIEPSVGDAFDDALAETVTGLFKAKVIRRRGSRRSLETFEIAALDWVDRFDTQRPLEPMGDVPPAEAEERYHAQAEEPAPAA